MRDGMRQGWDDGYGRQRRQAPAGGGRPRGGRRDRRDAYAGHPAYGPYDDGRGGAPCEWDDPGVTASYGTQAAYGPQDAYGAYGPQGGWDAGPQAAEPYPDRALRQAPASRQAGRGGGMPYVGATEPNPYSALSRGSGPSRRHGVVGPILTVLVAVALVAGGAAAFAAMRPQQVSVTVNGRSEMLPKGATLAEAKERAGVSTRPGRLLAVDGSTIDEAGGTEQTVTVNGSEVASGECDSLRITEDGTSIEFADGRDETETFSSTEEREPFVSHYEGDPTATDYWAGSIHLYQHGQDGVTVTKRGDRSGIEVTEQVQQRQDERFVTYSAQPPAGEKVIALTFDDGPWDDSTDEILDILESNGAKATFFTVGKQVGEHARQVRRQRDLGCLVLTHTWDHAAGSGQGVNLTYMSADEQVDEVMRGYGALRDLFGEEPLHMFRAPGGNFYGGIVSTLKPYVDVEFGWDVDTEDWKQPGVDAIYSRIMSATSGNIVLMHDGGGDRSQTVAAVSRAVPELAAQGYRFVTVDELLAYGVPDAAES